MPNLFDPTLKQAILDEVVLDLQDRSKSVEYRHDPVRWAQDVLGVTLWSKQKEVLESIVTNKKTAVKSCHATGKTFSSAVAVCWWISTRPNSMVRSTAPTSYQVHELLWEEIRKMHAQAGLIGDVNLKDEWKRPLYGATVLVGSGKKPSDTNIHAFQGVHRPDGVLTVIDEACHDDETEVLTHRGWLLWKDVTAHDEFLTWDTIDDSVFYQKAERLISYHYEGPMYYYGGGRQNSLRPSGSVPGALAVTPNHSLVWRGASRGEMLSEWRRSDAQDMALDNRYGLKTIPWSGTLPDKYTVPAYVGTRKNHHRAPLVFDIRDWAEFLGWFASEGHVTKNHTQIGISQSQTANPENCERIALLLDRMGLSYWRRPAQFEINSKQLATHLVSTMGRTCDVKRLPEYVRDWPPELLSILLNAYVDGDGTRYTKKSQNVLYTSNRMMADDLHEAALKTGHNASMSRRKLRGVSSVPLQDGRVITSTRDGWVIYWSQTAEPSFHKFSQASTRVSPYRGMVYCATIRGTHTLFTRRHGKTMWSGNCGVPQTLYTAADAISTGTEDRVLAVGNPDDPDTEFGNIFLRAKDGLWNLITVSAYDTPNFTGEFVPEIVSRGLIQPEWVEQRKAEWGEDSSRFKAKILAEFPDQSDDAFFKQSVIDRAYDTEITGELDVPGCFGIDVASSGNDYSVVAINRGGKIRILDSWNHGDISTSIDRIYDLSVRNGIKELRIDAVGYGEAVVQQMTKDERFAGYTIISVKGSYSPRDKAAHLNARAEQYDNLRKLMLQGKVDLDRTNTKVNDQLLAIKGFLTPRGQIQIESKEDMRARGVKSPDELDSIVYAAADFAYLLNPGLPTGTKVYQELDDILDGSDGILELMSQF